MAITLVKVFLISRKPIRAQKRKATPRGLENLAEIRAMNAEADKALDERSGEVVERVAKKPRKEAKLDDALAALIASL